jgi:pseudaminic acid synthase
MSTFSKIIQLGNFIISNNSKAFIIAELSANHNGSIETAIETIKAAKRAGADCIKLQTYTPDTITIDSKNDDFLLSQGTIWDGKYLYDLYKEAFTPWEWHKQLFKVAKDEGLECFSSPFDKSAVDFLEKLDVPAYKIASFEITDTPLIKYVASKGKPIIISTGIAKEEDILLAINTCIEAGNNQVILLKCTSSYPASIDEANLIMINDLREKYGLITGLSDHTIGSVAPITSISLGAKVIEKHFILDKSVGGPDASFSMTEKEFKDMVNAVRSAESSIGTIDYSLSQKQLNSRSHCRSLYVVADINKGDTITEKNVKSIRPGFGMHPKYLSDIIGKIANQNLEKGTRMSFDFISKKS